MIKPFDLIVLFKQALANHWGYIWGAYGQTWTEAKQRAATRDMTVKYGSKWIGHRVADCSGLVYWAFKQLGGTIYHGSHTMYVSYTTARGDLSNGNRADGQPLKPGTAVFKKKKATAGQKSYNGYNYHHMRCQMIHAAVFFSYEILFAWGPCTKHSNMTQTFQEQELL